MGKKSRVKKRGQKIYTMTAPEMNKYTMQAVRKGLSVCLSACIEEFGWSVDDVERAAARVARYMDAVNDGLITLEDIERIVGEEIGAEIWARIY